MCCLLGLVCAGPLTDRGWAEDSSVQDATGSAARFASGAGSNGEPATGHERSVDKPAAASGSASSTSELIVNHARIPPVADSPAHATIAMWNPSVIAAGS